MFWSPKSKDDTTEAKESADTDEEEAADEATPLLDDSSGAKIAFRRRSGPGRRESIRGSLALLGGGANVVQPVDALAPLVAGGTIVCIDGYKTSHPPSSVKSLPTFVPFRRKDRHRNFYLWWTNEFRHWWKSSRLLVRLAGLYTLAMSVEFIDKMMRIEPFKNKSRALEKNSYRALRVVKKLGRGGPMKMFLNNVHPFTRSLRILVGQ